MQFRYLGQEDPLEEGIATHSSILAWRIPWTEEPGRPQFCLPSGYHQVVLCIYESASVLSCLFICFIDSSCKWDHTKSWT